MVRAVRKEWRRGRGEVKEKELVAMLEESLGPNGETKIKIWFSLQELGTGVMVQEAKLRVKVEGVGGNLVKVVEGEEGGPVSGNSV